MATRDDDSHRRDYGRYPEDDRYDRDRDNQRYYDYDDRSHDRRDDYHRDYRDRRYDSDPHRGNYDSPRGPRRNNSGLVAALIGTIAVICVLLVVFVLIKPGTGGKKDSGKAAGTTSSVHLVNNSKQDSTQKGSEESENSGTTSSKSDTSLSEDNVSATAASEVSDKLDDFTFSLNDTVYRLPMSYNEFTGGEWKIDADAGVDETEEIAGKNAQNFWVTNGSQQIELYAYNPTGDTRQLRDCRIGGIVYHLRDGGTMKIAKGISLDSTPDDVITAFGNPTENSSNSQKSHFIYETDNGGKVDIELNRQDSQESRIEMLYMPVDGSDNGDTSTDRPSYLDDYKAPTQLSSDPTVTQFRLDGDLYQLPCPVSEFENNGWTLNTSGKESVPGQSQIGATLKKGQHSITVKLSNFDTKVCTLENSAVTWFDIVSYKNSENQGDFAEFPGGINLGSSESKLDSTLTAFQKSTSGSQLTWSYDPKNVGNMRIFYQMNKPSGDYSVSITNENWNY